MDVAVLTHVTRVLTQVRGLHAQHVVSPEGDSRPLQPSGIPEGCNLCGGYSANAPPEACCVHVRRRYDFAVCSLAVAVIQAQLAVLVGGFLLYKHTLLGK